MRAKITVLKVAHVPHSKPGLTKVTLEGIFATDPREVENAEALKADPNVKLEFVLGDPEALAELKKGQSYFLDFTEVKP